MAWNWRVTPTLLEQWYFRKQTLNANAARDPGAGPAESTRTKRLGALARAARKLTKSFMHNHLPRYVLRVLSRAGLVFLPEDILTTLAHGGTDVTLIVSPEHAEQFTAKGGRSALDRLRRTSHPPRVIATPTGDHSGNHPAILAAIRNAVLPDAPVSPSEHIPVLDDTSIESPNPLAANRNDLPKGSGKGIFSTG